MPHKNPEDARAWRRQWWKRATKARADQNAAARRRHEEINAFLREQKVLRGCKVCGYNKHHSALEFHHRNSRDKKLNLSFAKSLAQAKRELKKCDVICANCHRIHHWNEKHPCKPDIFALTYEAVE